MSDFSWLCPYCNQHATITDSNFSKDSHWFSNNNKDGELTIFTNVIICPNKECREYTIKGFLYKTKYNANLRQTIGSPLLSWNMKPASYAKIFPTYIPESILADYQEACLIRDLSPKASATLSRRCLQGMIRDYWKVQNKPNLFEEINAIKDKIEPSAFLAIDAVRSLGNIGAHMEKDINLILDVDPEEAQLLIKLIENLFKEWYISRHEREKHFKDMIEMASAKKEQKEALSFTNNYSDLLTFTHTHSPLLTNPLSALARRLTHELHNCKKLRRLTPIKFSIEISEEIFFLRIRRKIEILL